MLIAATTQAAPADKNFSYSWIEGGYSNVDVRDTVNKKLNGGYLRGSFALGANFYLLGSYSQGSKSWTENYQDTIPDIGYGLSDIRDRYKLDMSKAEIGIGGHYALSPNLDFTGEISGMLLETKAKRNVTATELATGDTAAGKASEKERANAGKLMLGLRAKPLSALELWGKAGYAAGKKIENGALANVGAQFLITPNFGLVGEAEIYKDVRFYSVGLRASF